MSKIPLYLITGFLGSGKTTMLKNIVNSLPKDFSIAVVQNDFAPLGVDALSIDMEQNQNVRIMQANGGIVFCVCMAGDFIDNLSAFVEREKPQAIFVEASGLSDPIAIMQMIGAEKLRDKLFLAKVYCVVDGTEFFTTLKKYIQTERQLRIADIVLINKSDLCHTESLNNIQKHISQTNPLAQIVRTINGRVYFNICSDPEPTVAAIKEAENSLIIPLGRSEIDSKVFRTHHRVDTDALLEAIALRAEQIIRCKGYVINLEGQAELIQSSFDKVSKVKTERYDSLISEFVCIGHKIDVGLINSFFR